MAYIICCKDCPDRLVTEDYNCHDHCSRYQAERETTAYAKKIHDQAGRLYAQRDDAIRKTKKKWRHHK